jgi:hypothetical protein
VDRNEVQNRLRSSSSSVTCGELRGNFPRANWRDAPSDDGEKSRESQTWFSNRCVNPPAPGSAGKPPLTRRIGRENTFAMHRKLG